MVGQQKGKLTFIWCVPRGRSTAFMRCLTNRPNTKGYFEPFSFSFYAGPDSTRNTQGFEDVFTLWPQDDSLSLDNIMSTIEQDRNEGIDVVVKDFGWYIYKHLDKIPADARHVILVRDPILLGFSTLNVLMNASDQDISARFLELAEELYGKTGLMYSSLIEMEAHFKAQGNDPFILDSVDLSAKPYESVKKVCKFLNIDFTESMLSWKSLEEFTYPDNWVCYDAFKNFDRIFNWVGGACKSSGLKPAPEYEVGAMPWSIVPPNVMAMLKIQQKYYDQIKSVAEVIEPNTTTGA